MPLRIVGSNYGLFGVSEDSGKLELTASPDREQRDMYILRVKVDIVFCLKCEVLYYWFVTRKGEKEHLYYCLLLLKRYNDRSSKFSKSLGLTPAVNG